MTWKTAHGFAPDGKPATVDVRVLPRPPLTTAAPGGIRLIRRTCDCGLPTTEFGIDRVCRPCRVIYQRGT